MRIGGIRNLLDDTQGYWVNDTSILIQYGDLTKKPFYNPKTMALIPESSPLYVKNSTGKMVCLKEIGWAKPTETPTHLVLYFTSSYEGINFIGSTASILWIDNIKFTYKP